MASHKNITLCEKDPSTKPRGRFLEAVFTIVVFFFRQSAVLHAEDAPEFTRQFVTYIDQTGRGPADSGRGLPTASCFESQPMSSLFCCEDNPQYLHDVNEDWQLLPSGLMYRSYLAGEKEPRFQFLPMFNTNGGTVLETAMGGRVGLLRYGTHDSMVPEGWQFDMEGGVLARLDAERQWDLDAADFRVGFLSTWRQGPDSFKAGYYHISSHIGDEFLIANPGFVRLNYVRDSLIVGWTHDLTLDTQVYGEIGYAFNYDGGALPLEFQFGVQYSPTCETGLRGAPFSALNVHIREDYNFATSINLAAGWQWRGMESDHRFRLGLQCFNGPSAQYSFGNQHETLVGGGAWFDF